MKKFGGNALFLDRSDINTDEIIPARYLSEITKNALQPHLMEDLCLDGFVKSRDLPGKQVIVTRANFGCGSSREHAPWALEVNGIHLVVAEGFSRIFRQNMFNCGMMAVDLPQTTIQELFAAFSGGGAGIHADLSGNVLIVRAKERTERVPFAISDFDRALIEAGGWVEYADSRY